MSIHPTAIVDPGAELGEGVIVHPFTLIEGGVQIGDRCEIGPHAVIRTGTRMGPGNRVTIGAVIADFPQDLKFHNEPTYVHIGADNHIREYVTIHRATGEGNSTVIGDGNMLMAYSHVGHNCVLGNSIMLANVVQLAGHTVVEDFVVMGGLAGTHQFTRIGTMCMVAARAGVRRDAPPYMLMEGDTARPLTLNLVGLRRRGVSAEAIAALKLAHRLIYRSDQNVTEAIALVRQEVPMLPEVQRLIEFLEHVPEGRHGRQLN